MGNKIKPLPVFDGFESGKLADFWRPAKDRYEPGTVTVQREIVCTGNYATKIIIHEGDIRQFGKGVYTERTELDSGKRPLLGKEVWYGFSIFLPKDFPIIDKRLVLAQWKQETQSDESPILAIRFVNGELYSTVRIPEQAARKAIPGFQLDQWHHFVVQIKYSKGNEGLVRIWMNDKKVFDYQGRTALVDGENLFNNKVGLYRNTDTKPMVLYLDNYRVGFSHEEVKPPLCKQN